MPETKTRRKPPGRDFSFRIARIAGIDLRVHVSFLLIVVVFALGSAGPAGPGVASGLGWLGLIFACVVAHEMAHSLVARRRGATVNAIVLLPIGGVSKLENLPENPRDEFAIAVVGPLTSFAIAGVGAIACLLAGVRLLPVDLARGAIVHRLLWLNLLLGAFNLLPAFPLDGGRVLRALLERRLDLATATRRAAKVGRLLALAMVAAGIAFNVWLVVIGIFVYVGASSEEVATIVHARIKDLRVRDVMVADPATVEALARAGDTAAAIRSTAQRDFPVVSLGRYVGMLSAEAAEEAPRDVLAADLADREAPTLAPDDPLEGGAMQALGESRRAALAVLREDAVVGLLRQEDVARTLRRATRAR